MNNKDLLQAYKVITEIMEKNNLMMDNSFRRVQSWISNQICDNLQVNNIKED